MTTGEIAQYRAVSQSITIDILKRRLLQTCQNCRNIEINYIRLKRFKEYNIRYICKVYLNLLVHP